MFVLDWTIVLSRIDANKFPPISFVSVFVFVVITHTHSFSLRFVVVKSRFYGYVKDRTNEILNINNQIAFLQKDLETTEKKRILLAAQVERQQQDSSNKALELGQILMAVENLVQRCLSKKRKRHARKKANNNNTNSSSNDNNNSNNNNNSTNKDNSTVGAAPSNSSNGNAANGGKNNSKKKQNDSAKATLKKKCEQASRDLDIIQQYIGDYEEIFSQCPKESRLARP